MKFRLLRDRFEHPAGTIVYRCSLCDYGIAHLDAHVAREPYISVTLREDGGYPFFTVPEAWLEEMT